MFDTRSFPHWPRHLMDFTVHLINNHTDGWYDDVLTDARLVSSMSNSACDRDFAVREYLDLTNGVKVPSAIFGCRCSGASLSVAALAAIDNIAMLSPESTSTKLSNKDDYTTFSRTISPDDRTGQVGALITLLKSFGWDRISILNTDTQFTQDITLELTEAWKGKPGDDFRGEIGHIDTIKLNNTSDEVDPRSVVRVLNAIPVGNPNANSRIIVMFAHHQHAFPILEIANKIGFQPDTIWVGPEWIGREPLDGDSSWMPPVPGYLGIMPYRNRTTPQYIDYLQRLQEYERQNNLNVTEGFTDFLMDVFPDSILAIAKALSAVPKDLRRDGRLVSKMLRELEFDGISGRIAFDEQGDLKNPRFTVATRSTSTEWAHVGFVTPTAAYIAFDKVCFAVVGCGTDIPNDEYPPIDDLLPFWIWLVVASLVVASVLFVYQRRNHRTVAEKLQKIEEELKSLDSDDNAVKQRKGRLYKEIADLLGQPTPEHWTDEHGLVEVQPTQQEYWDVLSRFRATGNEGETYHLSKLSRVQNVGIWSYYVFRKNQLANKYRTDLNDSKQLLERSVWHGTSSLNSDVIWSDQQDGFLMQLAQQGQWGRGIYFSERSGYSDPYSFKPFAEDSDTLQQDRELFLVNLLVGESVFLDRNEGPWMEEACKNLVNPPDNPQRYGLKFDTVEGEIDDEAKTRVFVVYENGRAYPEYLVRYYKGERDPARTPHQSLEEALVEKALKVRAAEEAKENEKGSTAQPEDDMHSVSSIVSVEVIWQFVNDNGEWENYLNGHQIQIEQSYKHDSAGIVTIQHFPWTYAIDFNVNVQTNLDHEDLKSRKVRRIHLGNGV